MTECPRCLTAAAYLTPDHLERCGAAIDDGNWSRPKARWLARDYVGRSPEEQAEMRAIEMRDVGSEK